MANTDAVAQWAETRSNFPSYYRGTEVEKVVNLAEKFGCNIRDLKRWPDELEKIGVEKLHDNLIYMAEDCCENWDNNWKAVMSHHGVEFDHRRAHMQEFKETEQKKSPLIKPKGRKYGDLWGFKMTQVMRWMGKNGWDKKKATRCFESMGMDPSPETINAQLRAGKKGERGKPADLKPFMIEDLENHASE